MREKNGRKSERDRQERDRKKPDKPADYLETPKSSKGLSAAKVKVLA